jgi:hypothetical protein
MLRTMQMCRTSGSNLHLLPWLRDMVVKLQRDKCTNAWMYHSTARARETSAYADKSLYTAVARECVGVRCDGARVRGRHDCL